VQCYCSIWPLFESFLPLTEHASFCRYYLFATCVSASQCAILRFSNLVYTFGELIRPFHFTFPLHGLNSPRGRILATTCVGLISWKAIIGCPTIGELGTQMSAIRICHLCSDRDILLGESGLSTSKVVEVYRPNHAKLLFYILNGCLCPSNFPFHVFNTDFLSSLLIVIEPFSLLQVNTREFGW
jgi:hypothetical protein